MNGIETRERSRIETALKVVAALGFSGLVSFAIANSVDASRKMSQTQAAIDAAVQKGGFFETTPDECHSHDMVPTGSNCLSIRLRGDILNYLDVRGVNGDIVADNRPLAFNKALEEIKRTQTVAQAWRMPDPDTREFTSLLVIMK